MEVYRRDGCGLKLALRPGIEVRIVMAEVEIPSDTLVEGMKRMTMSGLRVLRQDPWLCLGGVRLG